MIETGKGRGQDDETRPLLSHPAGPSRRRWGSEGTSAEDVLCEMCGTAQKGPELITLNRIFGRQIVEECCGATLDILFKEQGADFAGAFFEEFAENPTDPRFGFFRWILVKRLKRAQERVQKVSTILAESQSIVEAID